MAGRDQYTAKQFIDAIPGTGGIISSIASRVGCAWHTAAKYINNYATVKRAYDDECQRPLDLAESIVLKNMELAQKQQKDDEIADSGDARWYLTMKGAERGYAAKHRHELTGKKDEPLRIVLKWGDDGDADAGTSEPA